MGKLLSRSQRSCNNTQDKKEDEYQKNLALLKEDSDYFYEDEKWVYNQKMSYFFPEKFITLFRGYKTDQERAHALWDFEIEYKSDHKKGHVMAPEWKVLMRRAMPLNKTREIILYLFGLGEEKNDQNYSIVLREVFANAIPDSLKNAPTFVDNNNLEEFFAFHLLNKNGVTALKRILRVVHHTFYKLEYSPMLFHAVNILLIFLSEGETFYVLKSMYERSIHIIEMTRDEDRLLRWHMTFKEIDYLKFCKSCIEDSSSRSKDIKKLRTLFLSLNLNYEEIIKEWTRSLFFGFLPFPLALKIFLLYLNEGVKIYYRAAFSLFKVQRKIIIENAQSLKLTTILRDDSLSFDDEKCTLLIKKIFSFRMGGMKTKLRDVDVQGYQTKLRRKLSYHLPYIKEKSDFVTMEEIETIWDWFSGRNRVLDPKLVFSTKKDGFFLEGIFKATKPYKKSQMLMLVETHTSVFGCFCTDLIHENKLNVFLGNSESFLFILRPFQKKYTSNEETNEHLFVTKEYISFGASNDGVAFQIDQELDKGHTYVSLTYQNDLLNGLPVSSKNNMFQVIKLEVFLLDHHN